MSGEWKVEDQEGQNEVEQVVTGESATVRQLARTRRKYQPSDLWPYRTNSASYLVNDVQSTLYIGQTRVPANGVLSASHFHSLAYNVQRHGDNAQPKDRRSTAPSSDPRHPLPADPAHHWRNRL